MTAHRWAARVNLLLGSALMLAVWVLLVWTASRPALKTLIDLTPQQVNSVAPSTEALLRELREQKVAVEFHLFFPRPVGQPADEAMAQVLRIRGRLQELTRLLLRRYQWLGGESVAVFDYDLQSDIERTRAAALAFGYAGNEDAVVVAAAMPGRERRFRSLSLLSDLAELDLPGLRDPSGPAQAKVPTLKRYLGEVVLSSALKSLLVQGTPVAYLLRGYSRTLNTDNPTIGAAYGRFVAGLRNLGFDVRDLSFSREHAVPRDAALVIVLEPDLEFTDVDATALFDHVAGGGRLFLNYVHSPREGWGPTGGKLGELLGYELGQLPVFHLIPDPLRRTSGPGLDGNDAVARLQLQVSALHPVTRRLAQAGTPLEVGGARGLRERPGAPAGMRREPLLQTGPHAWLGRPGRDGYPDLKAPPANLLQPFLVGLAIEVDPKTPAGGPETAAPPKGQVVIVSGAFCNNSGIEAFGDLAYNVCNWMAERRVLMDIQSNQYAPRQMLLQTPQVERVRWLLFYGVPLGFLLAGLAVLYVRRRS
ncbi:MAG: hypothetical protein FJ265_04555 [Planctomycetes bacterium]|nr:hypothetical protein [Planctomycetota bacterium]